jgi:4-diphosphocytidyl-2-C-methyl-D-erythritol kinase
LNDNQLGAIGVRLGADVPFFIPCRPALAAGIGDILTAVPPLPRRWVVLVVPPFAVPTPWAFRRFDTLPLQPQSPSPACGIAQEQWPLPAWLSNDLERAVIPEYPVLAHIKAQLLQQGAEVSLMSGSGSAVFGIFVQRQQAESTVPALQQYGKVFLVHILDGPEQRTEA